MNLLKIYAIWFSVIAIWGFITYWLFILVHSRGVPYGGPVGLVAALIEIIVFGPLVWKLMDKYI